MRLRNYSLKVEQTFSKTPERQNYFKNGKKKKENKNEKKKKSRNQLGSER